MPLVNPTLPADGEDIDASDIATPIQTILTVLNGGIDSDNIEPGSMPWSIMQTLTNAIDVDSMKDAGNLRISRSENSRDHVVSGLAWTADSSGASLAASMTAGVAIINGRRLTFSAITAHAFGASADYYVYAVDNLDGTGSISTSTSVSNNSASPSMSANNMLIAIIQTGATLSTSGINQGAVTSVLPIATSQPYTVTDTNGNVICPRGDTKLLGYRQITTNPTTTSTTGVALTGLSMPIIIPAGRKAKVSLYVPQVTNSGGNGIIVSVWDGVPFSGTEVQAWRFDPYTGSAYSGVHAEVIIDPPSLTTNTAKTYAAGWLVGAGTGTIVSAGVTPAYIKAEIL